MRFFKFPEHYRVEGKGKRERKGEREKGMREKQK
jgi:hypothetical protein